jgi:hypothetical protein
MMFCDCAVPTAKGEKGKQEARCDTFTHTDERHHVLVQEFYALGKYISDSPFIVRTSYPAHLTNLRKKGHEFPNRLELGIIKRT